jgi:hypothetical protein
MGLINYSVADVWRQAFHRKGQGAVFCSGNTVQGATEAKRLRLSGNTIESESNSMQYSPGGVLDSVNCSASQ